MNRRSERGRGVEIFGVQRNLNALLAMLTFGIVVGGKATASSLTIMPLGDSITYGLSSPASVPGGYRAPLYRDLTAAGFSPVFVGSQTANPDPTLPAAAQSHEGHPGYQVDGTGSYANIALNTYIQSWLAPGNGVNPDFILLMIGANSILGQYHVAEAPYELAALVTQISHLRPNAHILVSTLTPQSIAANEAQVQQFNKTLSGPDGLIAQLHNQGENVTLVNVGDSITAADLSDAAHPTKAGYQKMGDAWFQAIEQNNIVLTPEPSTLALIGVGFAVAWTRSRRSRRRSLQP